jgi:hypothetical protein
MCCVTTIAFGKNNLENKDPHFHLVEVYDSCPYLQETKAVNFFKFIYFVLKCQFYVCVAWLTTGVDACNENHENRNLIMVRNSSTLLDTTQCSQPTCWRKISSTQAAGFLFGLHFDPEDGCVMFLRKIG